MTCVFVERDQSHFVPVVELGQLIDFAHEAAAAVALLCTPLRHLQERPLAHVAITDSINQEDARAYLVLCIGLPLVLLAMFLGEVIYAGLTSYAPWGDAEREWLARAAGRHVYAAGAWMIAGAAGGDL